MIAFRHAGLDPVPVVVRPPYAPPFGWRDLVPKTVGWSDAYLALHEWVGLLYYRSRG